MNFRDEENSKIFKNNYFQFKEIKIYHPEIDDENKLVLNKKGEPKPDRTLTDSVKINILDDTNSFFSDYLNRNPNTWFKEDEIILMEWYCKCMLCLRNFVRVS